MARDIITFGRRHLTDLPNTLWRGSARMTVQSNAGYVKIKSSDPTNIPESTSRIWVCCNMTALPSAFGKPEGDKQWIYEQTFDHHVVGNCKIGPASDKLAVLDSMYRVNSIKACASWMPASSLSALAVFLHCRLSSSARRRVMTFSLTLERAS
ncbi:hypothetical protein Micbo1qcDRAFT_210108 [Microdochium bolleyi]|uniref:Uncharacterized protein n=1 Tax=Microdochium bolleyi TaxID=196109 RepID=A0A136IJZ5_9PEZI|nr:hypothetical protein Micbo1qcDRAFT_210108 [Microdochium bolleyi]